MEKRAPRVLVVGNSDGVGLAFTRALLADGTWNVTGLSRSASPLDGESADYLHVVHDVTALDYRAALSALHDRRGPFDVCVYCAGIGEPHDLFGVDVFRVNLLGAVETAAVVIPSMIAVKRGHFVALSSIGDRISAAAPSYSASKAGLSSWLGGLAIALRPHNVHVTNLRLGFVDTKMAKSKVKPFMISAERAAKILEECLARRPMQRTFPRVMQLLVTLLGILTTLRSWFA